jgi:glutathione S-transferase
MSDPGIILHGTELSGHTHRVELLLRMLGLPYRTQAAPAAVQRWLSIAAGEVIYGPAAEHATIADLACYSYVAHAPEGGIALDEYESVSSWLRRVEALLKFKPMPASPLPPQG